MINALEMQFQVPEYLMMLIRSYLRNRTLIYDTSSGPRVKQVTSGAAQGSILGPDLWNAFYDELLRIEMPDDTFLVGYADDIAAVITARNIEEAERKLSQVMIRTQTWMNEHALKLATEKTELLILTKKHIPIERPLNTHFETFNTKRSVRYLGVHLDSKLTFWAQIQQATTKAARMTALLSRLMSNTGGPTASKRKLLMTVTESILLYGSEIWGEAVSKESHRKALCAVQRTAALRVASSYRTASQAAVLVISGTIPIDLLVLERRRIWLHKDDTVNRPTKEEIRSETIQTWQERWQNERYGRWTARLIPELNSWINRNFGEVNYYITQFLTGHGYFRKYLNRIGKAESPDCIYGDSDADDAEHTFFKCQKWTHKRAELERSIGPLTVENAIPKMLVSENNWNSIARYVESVLRLKKRDLNNVEMPNN